MNEWLSGCPFCRERPSGLMGLCRTGVSCADPALRNGNAAAHPAPGSSADGHSAGSAGLRAGNGPELECGEHRAGGDPGFTRCHYYAERKRPSSSSGGGGTTRRAVENQLEKRGVKTVELLVDLRMQPEEPAVSSPKAYRAAALAENTTRRASCGGVDLELFRTRQGCILRMRVGGQRFITLSGTVRPAKPIRAEWLLASSARPDNIRYTDCLTLSSKYRWMEGDAEPVSRCASVSRGERFSKRAEYDRIK